MKKLNILAIIPARGGSKRLPGKNIKKLAGKPLISYAISAALKSKYVGRVIVSTDDLKIASVAKKFKAEVPFIRPAKLATDKAETVSVLIHAVEFMETKENIKFDIVVLLQLTNPFVMSKDIDEAIKTLIKSRSKSCVSMCEVKERPEWVYTIKGRHAKPFYNFPKQNRASHFLPKAYCLNGTVFVISRDFLMKEKKIFDSSNMSAIIMPRERSCDIDYQLDFDIAEAIIKKVKKFI